ncbi:hypothetical protein RhiirA4_467563 [Rhizophagus irregularis]|uniref:Uncharacterized protein n=1 Tax=Rhizophagus irregularis TaxID=588596 RepID=A0A2I1GW56_9GLOM|nr:hypothetical protein RhiirA4_467563 [Rhizophagus irregularis]
MGNEEGQVQWNNYHNKHNFDQYMIKLKAKSCTQVMDRGKRYGIFYFESQEHLLRCLEAPHLWKIAQSHSLTQPTRQSLNDKKKNTTSSKGKAACDKPKPLTRSRGKSHHDKRTEDITQLLRLLHFWDLQIYSLLFLECFPIIYLGSMDEENGGFFIQGGDRCSAGWVARLKARQQLDSLSSQYQNSLPTLAKKLQMQQGKKGKQKDQSNQHVSIETYANPVINKSMNIDDSADPSIAASQPNQKGNLRSTQSTSSTTTPIGTSLLNVITQLEEKNKKTWSHDVILNKLTDWDKVLEISFKPQHKYQSVWTKMILWPIIDTNFVMRTWCQKLDDISVRWYLEHWKLKNWQTFADFVQKKLKMKSCIIIMDKGQKQVIIYFESQKDLYAAMEVLQAWKMTISNPLYTNKCTNKSDKDKKKNLKSLKGKKAELKGSTSSNKSCDKSKKHNKMNDDTRSLLKLILNLLS